MAEKIKIGGELEAVTQDGKLADAAQVVDSTQNKTQELINSEVKEKLDAVINADGSVKIPTITLSGDVTGSGTTAISGTIANSAVTTAKIANSAVTNAKLANSSVTIGNKSVSLGGALTDIDTSGTLTASTIKKSGGTSAQFLKADGSVDSNSYAATSAIPTKVSALTNDAGYLTTHQDISGKVDKVSGKGLSTNDYTDADKEKVDGAFQTSNIITSSGQTPTTDKVFSSKVINDLVSSNYTTLNNAINQKADKTALPSAASATTAGLAKLYTSTGTNADGAMTQAAATTALGNKVDKESGKGLSTNDYTTAEKNKLSGIADNANNYTLPTASGSVLGGVKVGEGLSISNGVLNVSQDTDTRILYHAAQAPSSIATTYTGTYYVLADKNIAGNTTAAVIAYYSNGTAVNELTISAGEVRQCADGTRWQASGTGWTQIKSGVNVVQTTGTSTEDVMSQKAVTDELAKKVDLTGTQTISGTKAFTGASTFTGGTKNAVVNITSVNASRDYAHLFVSSNNSTSVTRPLILQKGYGNVAIGDSIAPSHKLEVAGTFQATGAATFSSSVTANSFVKSNGTSSQFLKADGSVDSSTYLTTHQDISGKVDKVDGKGLSTNDYTTDEKTKLANIEAAANRTVVDSAISSTSTNPVTSKAISTALASKVDAVSGKSLSTNDYTTAEKTKLAGIAEGANKTTVDTALSATSTNPVTNKAVTEALAEKADVSSYVKLVLKGVAEAYYANASSIPSSAADGNYICDTGSSSTIKRCITIREGGAVVNDVTATNGDFWLSKADGHVYAAVSNNTTSWVDCGKLQGEKGDKGDKGADGADGADGTDGIDGAQTVVQTTGTSTTDVMSQAAVMAASMSLLPAHSFSTGNVVSFTLDQEVVDRFNTVPLISIKFCVDSKSTQDWYHGVYTSSLTENKKIIDDLTYYTGINIQGCYNIHTWHTQSNNASVPVGGLDQCFGSHKWHACYWFILNRITGEAWILDECGNQVGYRQHESMRYDNFINSDRKLFFRPNNCNAYELFIMEGDVRCNNWSTFNGTSTYAADSYQSTMITRPIWGTRSLPNTYNDDGYVHFTWAENVGNYWIDTYNYLDKNDPVWNYKKIEILSGSLVFTMKYTITGVNYLHVYDENFNDVTGTEIGAGVYHIFFSGALESRVVLRCATKTAGEARILSSLGGYSCRLFHVDNFNAVNNYLYDRAHSKLISATGISSYYAVNLNQTYSETNGGMANFIGKKKFGTDGKLYMVASDHTWKQINNS